MNPAGGTVTAYLFRIIFRDVIAVVSSLNNFRGGGIGQGVHFSILFRLLPISTPLVVKSVSTVRLVTAESAGTVLLPSMTLLPAVEVETSGRVVGDREGCPSRGGHGNVTRPGKRNTNDFLFHFHLPYQYAAAKDKFTKNEDIS